MDFTTFSGRRVLVTGSTGFKGSWLCDWLLKLGAEVHGFALAPEPDAPLFDQLKLRERIHQTDGDIRNPEVVSHVFAKSKPEIVLHLAAQPLVRLSYDEPKLTFDTNIAGGVNLLEAVRRDQNIKALIFVTSDKCYKNMEWQRGYHEEDMLGGHDPYSASKAAAELVFASYQDSYFIHRPGFGAASVRAGNVIGGGDFSKDRIIPDCIRALMAGDPVRVRNPQSTRPWQHVLEPLSGYLEVARRLLEKPNRYAGSWNFGPDAENVLPVGNLAHKAVEVWGSGSVSIEPDTNAPHEAGLLMLDSAKAKRELGWYPRWDFDQAVTFTVNWYKRVYDGEDPQAVTDEQIARYMGENT